MVRRALIELAILLLMFAGAVDSLSFAEEAEQALLVKAGFVTKFPSFVTWPDESRGGDNQPFVIGVLGKTALTPYLIKIARHVRIKGSEVEVRRIDRLNQLFSCHTLFIAATEEYRLDEVLKLLRGQPVLTVADTEHFATRGVLITLYQSGDRFRFRINKTALDKSPLAFNFRLLALADVISPGGEKNENP